MTALGAAALAEGFGDVNTLPHHETPLSVLTQTYNALYKKESVGCNSLFWARSGTVAALDPAKIEFQISMDELNRMMSQYLLPHQLRVSLRHFFTEGRQAHQAKSYRELLQRMSPLLQGEVAHFAFNGRWIQHVRWLRGCSDRFVVEIAKHMTTSIYAQAEEIDCPGALCVLS